MFGWKPKIEQPRVSALTKAGFHKRLSQIQSCKLSCKGSSDLVKIKNQSRKQSQVQKNRS